MEDAMVYEVEVGVVKILPKERLLIDAPSLLEAVKKAEKMMQKDKDDYGGCRVLQVREVGELAE
jgi:hypothetical protein